jgi:hypothetical protein
MMLRPVLLKLICQLDSIILKSSILSAPLLYGSMLFAPGSLDISLFKCLGLHQHVLLIDQISVAEVVGDKLIEGFVEPSN